MIALLLLGCSEPTETGKTAQPTDTGGNTDTGTLPDSDSHTETGEDSDTDTAPPPPDADGDGSPDDEDCAPDDPTIGTTIRERYQNGVDDDCDGVVDEALGEDDALAAMRHHPVLIAKDGAGADVILVAGLDDVWNRPLSAASVEVLPFAEAAGADAYEYPNLLGDFPTDFSAQINYAGDIDGDGVLDIAVGGGDTYSVYDPTDPPWMGALSGIVDTPPYRPDELPWTCVNASDPGTSDLVPFGDGDGATVAACDFSDSEVGVALFGRGAFADGEATPDEAYATVTPATGAIWMATNHPLDLDGDGGPDLLMAYLASETSDFALWVVLSGGVAPGTMDGPDVTVEAEPDRSVIVDGMTTADVDGDGYADMVLTDLQHDGSDETPQWRVYLGFATRESWTIDESTSEQESPVENAYVGEARNVGDRDGDGRDDVLLTANYYRGEFGGSDIPDTVAILPGAVLATPGTWSYDDALFRIDSPPDDNLFYPFVDADLDGSGYTDLVLRTNSPHWVEGAGAEVDGASLIFYDPGVL